ncbi:DUF6443 domain-containing protein [Chryseobacterium flavum]
MKKIITPIGLLLLTGSMYAQTLPNTENYIQTKVYLDSANTNKQIHTVQYFDGLGRPKQIVNVKASPLGRDVVTHIEYDQFGRQVKDYLPVPQSGTLNGAIVPNPLANATQPSLYGSEKIYAEKILENSPLDRIQQQIQVGNAWSSKPVLFGYDANTDGEVIKYTSVTTWENGATKTVIHYGGTFGGGQLYKNTVIDEDGNKTIEFKNSKGQVLMVRKVLSATENADTYYVYNEYDQLAWVVPPLLSKKQTWGWADQEALAYQYRYDGKNRLVEKKLPGKEWEHMVYNKADQLVLTRDANLAGKGQWLFTKYDQFGRVVYTGLINNTGSRLSLQNAVELNNNLYETRSTTAFTISGMAVYYSAVASPSSNIAQILSVNYYDSYPPGSPAVTNVFAQPLLKDDPSQNRSTKGLPVASYVKNIEDDNWTKTYTWYDTKGRVIGSRSINHLGGYTIVNHKLDFSGTVLQTNTYHKRLATDTQRNIVEYFTYDSQNRLTMHRHKVDSNPVEILAQNKYNELSQLENKKVGGVVATSPLQQIDYKYNIRGWMTKINDPSNLNGKLFGYEIRYHNPINPTNAAGRYNGNIAEIDWNSNSDPLLKRYNFEYDPLNRLKNAFYKEPVTGNSGNFDEYLTYDLNGNITNLKRTAVPPLQLTPKLVDNLDYELSGNRLTKITENALNDTGYEGGNNIIDYDANGNMINMKDKGIGSIAYNHLNLPYNFSITEKDIMGNYVNIGLSYLYRADGVKLRKTYITGGGKGQSTTNILTDYLDGFQYSYREVLSPCEWCRTSVAYEQEAYKGADLLDPGTITPSWNLDFVPTSEGFYSFTENRYIYQYKDHLGNARVNYAKNSEGVLEITDSNNYYPFGLNHIGGGKGLLGGYRNYKYNGKELQETGMYDYGARFYMPDIGRWGVIDELAENYLNISPFTYAVNNPIRYIDPDGRKIKDPDDIVKNYKNQLNSNMSALKAFIDNGSIDSELGGKLMSFYTSTLGEITKLEKSDQVYTIFSDSSSKEGSMNYDLSTNEIKIGIGDKRIGLVGHELKHAYQYESGETSLVVDNSAYGKLYDITDETASYNRERALGTGIQFFQTPNAVVEGYPLKMTDGNVKDFGKGMTPPAYQTLPSGPIDIHSKEGKALRQQTIQAGKIGTAVQEVYKGWEKDYQKGSGKK